VDTFWKHPDFRLRGGGKQAKNAHSGKRNLNVTRPSQFTPTSPSLVGIHSRG